MLSTVCHTLVHSLLFFAADYCCKFLQNSQFQSISILNFNELISAETAPFAMRLHLISEELVVFLVANSLSSHLIFVLFLSISLKDKCLGARLTAHMYSNICL